MKLTDPAAIAVITAFAGVGMVVGGVFMLAGAGWALIVAAAPVLGVSAVIIRGLTRAADPE